MIFGIYFSRQTGAPCKSFPPWPNQHSPGGGAVIPCSYRIEVKTRHENVFKKVQAAVKAMEESTVLEVQML